MKATLIEQLKSANAATKALLAVAVLAIAGLIAFTGSRAGTPHFKLLYSGLDASQAAGIQSALAGGNLRYEVSQPPGPFVIHVEESQYYAAQNLVALSGALESVPEGIRTNDGGASQVFLSAPERAQSALKREWQELENQLEELDFVVRARVSTSTPEPSPLRGAKPMTVAVTLQMRGSTELSQAQASTVAKLVRYRFNVPQQNVIVSDQSGRTLVDGSEYSESNDGAGQLEHKARFDGELAARTNQVLDRVFGPGMAYVVVSSDWLYQQSESVKETLGKPVVVSKTESKSETPQGGTPASPLAVGGATGEPSQADFGTAHAAVPGDVLAQSAGSASAKTTDTKTSSLVGKETEHRRRSAPELQRLSVSLFLDKSLEGQLGNLEQAVKASVGFVESEARKDSFSSLVTPFASIARDDEGKLIQPAAEEPAAEPNRWLELLIRRGVEIACALAFVFVLLKTLKGLPRKAAQAAAAPNAGGSGFDEHELDELARAQIEELVKSEPERVSTILARWAADEAPLAKSPR